MSDQVLGDGDSRQGDLIRLSDGALVLSCCGDSDSLYNAQMQRHDSTPQAERAPEVAVTPAVL